MSAQARGGAIRERVEKTRDEPIVEMYRKLQWALGAVLTKRDCRHRRADLINRAVFDDSRAA